MARVYRPERTIPIPAGAKLVDRAGKRCARFRWHGKMIEAPVTQAGPNAGQRIRVPQRHWAIEYTDVDGHVKRAGGFADKAATQAKGERDREGGRAGRAGIVTQRERDASRKITAATSDHVNGYKTHLRASGV